MFRQFIFSLSVGLAVLAVDVVPAYAHVTPIPCDFITSGGFVFTDANAEANFGAHGGCKNGDFWGHVNYVDHGTGLHVDSTQITGYVVPGGVPNARDICGIARINESEQTVRFRVRLIDNGEPGRDDQFGIRLSNGYVVTTRSLAGTDPGGGNVQLHEPNPSTTGPVPPRDEFTMCGGVEGP